MANNLITNNSITSRKIGLALGGGGAKGLAHIGVIRELRRANIPISYIAGTSMGALVGGVYAATRDLQKIEEIFSGLDKNDVFPMSKIIRKREGLFRNESILDGIVALVQGKNIEDCEIPFSAVAADIHNGDEVEIKKGDLALAIKASTAMPFAFRPVEISGRFLMDGGFVNPVPADVVRAMGADIVIAVDVSSRWRNVYEDPHPLHGFYSMLINALSVVEYEIAKHVLTEADIVLRPSVLSYSWLDFYATKEIVRAGEREAHAHIEEICVKSGYPKPVKTAFEKFVEFLIPQE